MARLTSREILEQLLKQHDRQIEAAFIDAIEDIADRAQIGRITEALRRGDIETALRAIGIQDESFDAVADAVARAYADAGRTTAANLPMQRVAGGLQAVFRFNTRNIQAEQWLKNKSSELVTRIGQGQREMAREALRAGMEAGRNPNSVALDIVGRIDRASNRRSGGVLGLNGPQEQYVRNARKELSGTDVAGLKNYLRRERRDKRFDPTVRKAIKSGEKLTAKQVDQITGRYSDRLLKLRGNTIARTEAIHSLAAAQHESYRQAIESGAVNAESVTVRWKATMRNTRDSHVVLHNTEIPFGGTFVSIYGSRLRFPGDTMYGALAGDIVNCACMPEYRVNFAKGRRL